MINLLILALSLSLNAALAGTGEFALRSNKAFYPPQASNEKLNKKISFVFDHTKLSEILLTLSKAGDFDIVLPQGLDPELSISINDKSIIDALREVIELAKYRYKFQNDTLIVSEIDIGSAEFEHIQILYNKASNITRVLNEEFFKQVIINQEDTAFKPYAFSNPGQNSITIVGNPSQLEAASRLVHSLDQQAELSFYRPGYIDAEDAQYLISSKLEKPSIEIKSITGALALKGTKAEISESIKILKENDKARKPINFYVEILRVDLGKDTEQELKKFENLFGLGKAQKINSIVSTSPEFMSIAGSLYREFSEVFLLGAREEKSIPGGSLSAKRDLLVDAQYNIKLFGQTLDHVDKNDIVAYFLRADSLIPDPQELYRLLKVQSDDYILVLIQQQ